MRNLFCAALIATFASFTAHASSTTNFTDTAVKPGILKVMGNGNLEVEPDMATVDLSVTTKSTVSRDAQNQNAIDTQRLIEAITSKYRLPSTQIKTTSYTVSPEYDPNDSRTILGYVVRHSLSIKLLFIEGVGDFVDTALANGATTIDFINFGLQQPKQYQLQAMKLAMDDAAAKANAIASSVGRRVIRVIRVSQGQFAVGSDKNAAQDRDPGTEIFPTTVVINASLEVTFEF